MKIRFRPLAVAAFWLLLWQIASLSIANEILFVGPIQVAASLLALCQTAAFWKTLYFSFLRILTGFILAAASGILMGTAAGRFSILRELLAPVILLFQSVPVASFVILALLWMGSANLSIFISFMVVFPVLYTAALTGLAHTDSKLLEMCRIFRVPFLRRVRAVYLPSLAPYLSAGADSALGLAIKSGVAAEVIGVPDYSIGSRLYTAKLYLSTADLLAWTLVIIAAAWLLEIGLHALFRALDPAASKPPSDTSPEEPDTAAPGHHIASSRKEQP